MIGCVVGIKAITNIPYALTNIALELSMNYEFLTFTIFVLVLSHGLNLFIYLIFNQEFRETFINKIKGLFCFKKLF